MVWNQWVESKKDDKRGGEERIFRLEETCSDHLAQLSEDFSTDKKLNNVAMGIFQIPV